MADQPGAMERQPLIAALCKGMETVGDQHRTPANRLVDASQPDRFVGRGALWIDIAHLDIRSRSLYLLQVPERSGMVPIGEQQGFRRRILEDGLGIVAGAGIAVQFAKAAIVAQAVDQRQ